VKTQFSPPIVGDVDWKWAILAWSRISILRGSLKSCSSGLALNPRPIEVPGTEMAKTAAKMFDKAESIEVAFLRLEGTK
jgi:hypothetical protein